MMSKIILAHIFLGIGIIVIHVLYLWGYSNLLCSYKKKYIELILEIGDITEKIDKRYPKISKKQKKEIFEHSLNKEIKKIGGNIKELIKIKGDLDE